MGEGKVAAVHCCNCFPLTLATAARAPPNSCSSSSMHREDPSTPTNMRQQPVTKRWEEGMGGEDGGR